MILIFNGRSCLPCTALPYSRNGCVPARGTPFYVRTISSVWGHFGCFTRSAFRRTPSLNKTHFWVMGSWCGVPSVFSRSSLGKIRQGTRKRKETTILIKSTFWRLGVHGSFLGSYLAQGLERLFLPWFVLGLWHGAHLQGTREGELNNRTFFATNLLLLLDVKLTIASNKKRIKK